MLFFISFLKSLLLYKNAVVIWREGPASCLGRTLDLVLSVGDPDLRAQEQKNWSHSLW